MEDNRMKNIVILKNLPSNLVEEAIVVLKQNKIKLPEYVENKFDKTDTKTNPKEYILKEAEMVISNYLSNIENNKIGKKKKSKEIEKKYHRLKFVTLGLFITIIVMLTLL